MASGTCFVRACPTCGRSLEVRIELLGREVQCIHCGATFMARHEEIDHVEDKRIEQALARAQRVIDSLNIASSEPL